MSVISNMFKGVLGINYIFDLCLFFFCCLIFAETCTTSPQFERSCRVF